MARARERWLGAVRAPRGRRAPARSGVMSPRHLSCQDCRIRVRASAPEIAVLEGSCPICGAKLTAVPFPSGVMGFRSFDLDVLAEGGSSDRPSAPAQPVDLVARREAGLA